MAEWQTVGLTSRCSAAPADGLLLLPIGSTLPKGRRVIVEGAGKSLLAQASLRADNGQAACVSGACIAIFGGEGARVRYRGVTFFETLWRDPWLAARFTISLLTLLGALLTGYLTFVENSAAKAGSPAHETAFIALAIAFALSLLTFLNEYH